MSQDIAARGRHGIPPVVPLIPTAVRRVPFAGRKGDVRERGGTGLAPALVEPFLARLVLDRDVGLTEARPVESGRLVPDVRHVHRVIHSLTWHKEATRRLHVNEKIPRSDREIDVGSGGWVSRNVPCSCLDAVQTHDRVESSAVPFYMLAARGDAERFEPGSPVQPQLNALKATVGIRCVTVSRERRFAYFGA